MSAVRYQRPVPMVFSGASGNFELPEGFLLVHLHITLVAGGTAISGTAPTITTVGLSGLTFRMSGVVAINAVDRLPWEPPVPLKIDRPDGATVPLIVFPAVTNGTWHCIAFVRPE
jgi:hypothetical protein